MTPPSPNPTPADGEDKLQYSNDIWRKVNAIFLHPSIDKSNSQRVCELIAQQNRQAVQKARLEEAKHFEHNISQFYDVNGNALDEIKQFARFRVEDLQRLTAAQPRKDEKGAKT